MISNIINGITEALDTLGQAANSKISLILLVFVLLGSLLVLSQADAAEVKPKTVAQLKETSVRIVNKEKNSGGSGSIYRSTEKASYILTNKHVCRLIEQGGFILYNDEMIPVTHYKKFDDHDLCMIRIEKNLNVSLKVSDQLANESSSSIVSGHPNLLPHVVTNGHLSERDEIEIAVGLRDCTEEDLKKNSLLCIFLGGMPILEKFDSQLTSNLIMPGSSGSAVFNRQGEIIGVIFAGGGDSLGFGYMVPQIYLLYFVQNINRTPWNKVGDKVDDKGTKNRIFDFNKCLNINSGTKSKIRDFCKSIANPNIWRK